MLKEERYERILELLEGNQYLSAQQLSRQLFVSLPTIRRDLAELQQRKQVVRSHGGAKKVQGEHTVAPLNFRRTVNALSKRALCRAAAELVQDNEIIFIDSSTTIGYSIFKEWLESMGVWKIDYLVMSHNIDDHAGGVNAGLVFDFQVGMLYHNGTKNDETPIN